MSEQTDSKVYFGRDLEAMSFADNYHQWILEEFSPYLGQHALEVGAGSGNFSQLLAQKVNRLCALEPSNNMYPLLQERFIANETVETVNRYMSDWFDDHHDCYDSAIYVNVLEHIENDAQELDYMYKVLRPGGHVLIFVPALSWLYSDLDKQVGHFRRYHKSPLRQLVGDAGFNVEELRYFDFFGILPWYIAFVLLKGKTSGANVSAYDKLIVPIAKKIEHFVTPPIGKNLLLIGQKPL